MSHFIFIRITSTSTLTMFDAIVLGSVKFVLGAEFLKIIVQECAHISEYTKTFIVIQR